MKKNDYSTNGTNDYSEKKHNIRYILHNSLAALGCGIVLFFAIIGIKETIWHYTTDSSVKVVECRVPDYHMEFAYECEGDDICIIEKDFEFQELEIGKTYIVKCDIYKSESESSELKFYAGTSYFEFVPETSDGSVKIDIPSEKNTKIDIITKIAN